MSCRSCKGFEIEVKPGDDIKWAGLIEILEVTDFTGYTVAAEFRAKNMGSNLPATLLGTATIEWIDQVAGTFFLLIPRAETALWKTNLHILLDISVVDPEGLRVRTETAEFMTTAGVTEIL